MLLAIDLENRYTNFGVFNKDKLIFNFKIKTDIYRSSDELYLIIKNMLNEVIDLKNIDDVIISCVVPDFLYTFKNAIKKLLNKEPYILGVGIKTGINIKCENPKEVGSDRIMRAVGAIKDNKNVIVINFSDVVTIDIVNEKREFLGGVIFPGIKILRDGLCLESSLLPKVEIEKPTNIIGNRTIKSIQSGIYYQSICALEGVVSRIKKEFKNINVVITGNFAKYIEKEVNFNYELVENLGLIGLNTIYRNIKKANES